MTTMPVLLQDAIYDQLNTVMPDYFTNLGYSAPRIKKGKLQDNPQNVSASIMIHIQSPRHPEWRDAPLDISLGTGFATGNKAISSWGHSAGMTLPAGRVGGGKTWQRRLTVQIRQFFTNNESRETSTDLASKVANKIAYEVQRLHIGDIIDEFGERAVKFYIDSMSTREGGGPGTFIWTTWIFITAETMNPNV